MGTWNSRGLRGSVLEEMINYSIEHLRVSNLAVIQKIPTPITPIEIDQATRHITLAYFDQKSTVDYMGVVQGIPICFDAKECASDTFPLQNIHAHQAAFMKKKKKQGGVAFFILYFTARQEYYYLRYREMMKFWTRREEGGRKSFRLSELDPSFFLAEKKNMIPILEGLQMDLDDRDDS